MNGELPKHVALILDGNRRWAKKNHRPSIEGHRQGAMAIRKIFRHLMARGVHTITMWIFSTENWKRGGDQVSGLMKLFEEFAGAYLSDAEKEGVRIVHLGRKDRLASSLRDKIKDYEQKTNHFTENVLNIALDYGGKDDILRAIRSAATAGIDMTKISADDLEQNLDTVGQRYPNPDMIVRTGGEQRMSGFMLWQGAYAEYFFTETLLPDLTPEHIDEMLEEYAQRQRRFGV